MSSQYQEAARAIRAPIDGRADDMIRELVRAATLAANSHNTQPWLFEADGDRIVIRPDFDRRTPAVDPDDHHLYASLGCAAENLAVAASLFSRSADVRLSGQGLQVVLSQAGLAPSALAAQIPVRQCTRVDYDGRRLADRDLRRLEEAGRCDTVDCRIFSTRSEVADLCDLIIEANTRQLENDAFIGELTDWIRFNDSHALSERDGLYSGVMGSPRIPKWLGKRILPFVLRPGSENKKYAGQIRSSAGLAVFCAKDDNPKGWIEAGRAYQHFALVATEMNLKHAFVNQPVEVAAMRPKLAELAGFPGRRPNLLIRFGYGPQAPYSLRRPVADVLCN